MYPLHPIRLQSYIHCGKHMYLFLRRKEEALGMVKSVYMEALDNMNIDESSHLSEAQSKECYGLMHEMNQLILQWEEEIEGN
mmetsp:Transcript_13614/g.13353  ORF Transcript_13614/g.13353 Transcript_13614/m.13353 type:complete len:82 (+) Transcript_13614:333-578(+)